MKRKWLIGGILLLIEAALCAGIVGVLWASIGLAHSSVGPTVVEVMRSAEAAMKRAADRGGDLICIGEPVSQEPQSTVV